MSNHLTLKTRTSKVAAQRRRPQVRKPIALYFERVEDHREIPDRDELSRQKIGDQNAPATMPRRQQKET
jgi:hypothetical protein